MIGIAAFTAARLRSGPARRPGSCLAGAPAAAPGARRRADALVVRRRRGDGRSSSSPARPSAPASRTCGRRTTGSRPTRRPRRGHRRPGRRRPPYFLPSTASRTRRSGLASRPPRATCTTRPTRWFPDRTFDRVLVIGAGSGTDVALALAKGAKHVDAVEIDPRLAQIGRDFHPEGVYDDPRVTVHVNDGRAFLRGTDEQYDLIVYALTGLADAGQLDRRRPARVVPVHRGVVRRRDATTWRRAACSSMYNLYREPWLVTKLDGDARATSSATTPLRPARTGRVRRSWPPARRSRRSHGGPPPGDQVDPVPTSACRHPKPATDDWPFLYLRTGTSRRTT